jgi:hypothetical protein
MDARAVVDPKHMEDAVGIGRESRGVSAVDAKFSGLR